MSPAFLEANSCKKSFTKAHVLEKIYSVAVMLRWKIKSLVLLSPSIADHVFSVYFQLMKVNIPKVWKQSVNNRSIAPAFVSEPFIKNYGES